MNKEEKRQYDKKWRLNNKEKIKQSGKKYRLNNKEKIKQSSKEYRLNNKEKIKQDRKERQLNNKENLKQYNKEWRLNNKEKTKQSNKKWRLNNKEKINLYGKYKRKNDPIWKLRRSISRSINMFLKKGGFSKNNESILNYLSYTIEELKQHLESLFEPWMHWNNHGQYKSNIWNDNDPSTWVWNIDHIIPQSKLLYSSMEDDSFKKCWALSNLRPYSAKQNILDGNQR